jgi:hypothetical protein
MGHRHLFGIDHNEGYQFGYVLEHNPSFYLFDDATRARTCRSSAAGATTPTTSTS